MCDLLPGIIPQPGKKFAPNASGYGTPCACQSWVLRPGFSMAREVFYLKLVGCEWFPCSELLLKDVH